LVIDRRVLIGRRPFNTVMVADPSVSRIHAWIGARDGRYVLHDAGSRAGTLVNGEAMTEPRWLAEGDEIRIGPAVLVYSEAEELPEGVGPLEHFPPPPAADPYDGGIYFDCACGGPMWVTAELAGKSGRCRYCGERLVVPHTSGQLARPIAPAVARGRGGGGEAGGVGVAGDGGIDGGVRIEEQRAVVAAGRKAPGRAISRAIPAPPEVEPSRKLATCSICQTDILPSEASTRCPSCHLTFHEQCWQENYGCSAYGCDQVNVLAAMAAGAHAVAAVAAVGADGTARAGDYQVPAEQAMLGARHSSLDLPLLAGSFVAMGLGALAYGIPSAVMVLLALLFLLAGKARRKSLGVVALAVGVVGVVAGYATSMFWWRGVRVWETFLR
jgi:hypothetical protein